MPAPIAYRQQQLAGRLEVRSIWIPRACKFPTQCHEGQQADCTNDEDDELNNPGAEVSDGHRRTELLQHRIHRECHTNKCNTHDELKERSHDHFGFICRNTSEIVRIAENNVMRITRAPSGFQHIAERAGASG